MNTNTISAERNKLIYRLIGWISIILVVSTWIIKSKEWNNSVPIIMILILIPGCYLYYRDKNTSKKYTNLILIVTFILLICLFFYCYFYC